MNLMIVESPNKIAKISAILGDGWKVAASVGHIRDLPKDRMGVKPPDFMPEYVYTDRGEATTEKLRELVSKAENVYLATDPDREGEAIAWHLKEALNLKKYKRVTFDSLNEQVVERALAAERQIDDNLVWAQQARRTLDRLCGWMASPALSDASGTNGLSAGRVQSPAVRLIVERERAIQIFRVTNHFGAQVNFGEWVANWDVKPYLKGDEEYLMDRELAEQAASIRNFRVTASESKPSFSAPPAPFRTVTLIQAASIEFKFSSDKTMGLAQKLYAAGHTNYHRTDKQNFADETNEMIRQFAEGNGWKVAEKFRKWKEAKSAQEGHEAICPAHLEVKTAGDTEDERKLYDLIWKRAIASQMQDAEYKVNTLEIEGESEEGKIFLFNARGKVLVRQGWKALMAADSTTEEDEDDSTSPDGSVPLLKVGDSQKAESGKVTEKKTQPPGRYTEASLVKKLEDSGIGRPSTYATILKTIVDRGYIEIEKNKLVPTQLGMLVVISLVKAKCDFIEYEFTAEMEGMLDKIASGDTNYLSVVKNMYGFLQEDCARLKSQANEKPKYPCPKCGKNLRRLPNKDKSAYFWGCSAYSETGCDGSLLDNNGVPGKKVEQALSKYLCGSCQKPLVHKIKKGKYDFWSCSDYPKCKQSYKDVNGKPLFEKRT